jgi:O-antigen/teichoic acid export membrane protein
MTSPPSPPPADRPIPPILGRVWRGTFWLALKSPLQVIIAFVSVPLIQNAIGAEANGAYVFAWGFGFIQFLLEFGMGAALQRQVTLAWTRGDRDGVNRLVASGMAFYTAMAAIQMVLLLAIAYLGLPPTFQGETRRLIIGLLWIQALSAPFYGLLTVASCVLQAASRYEVVPRLDLVLVIVRFAVLLLGLRLGVNFVAIVASQTVVALAGMLMPVFWVMVHELGCVPRLAVPRRADYSALFHFGFYIFLMQVSVVLADKIDTTILGYALPDADPGPSITVYQNVSRPFFQLRQTGWTLAYLVIPAVASLTAVRDVQGLEQLKYDGTRLLIGSLVPVGLLAGIYAGPFLDLWVGPRYVPHAWLLRLFLVAALPLALSVPAQMAIGLGKLKVVALSPLVGSLVNLPLSYYLTTQLGVSGVIWGTVLTTLLSNLLVPGMYLFRLLEFRLSTLITRTMSAPLAGAALLVPATWFCRAFVPPEPVGATLMSRSLPLLLNLVVGSSAYLLGYFTMPTGRSDLIMFLRQIRQHRLRRR